MSRPTFNPADYETAELAELNRPLHDIGWDMIEAESALTALSRNRASPAEWDAQFAIVIAARKVHADALAILDAQVEAYCARMDAAPEDTGDSANQIDPGL